MRRLLLIGFTALVAFHAAGADGLSAEDAAAARNLHTDKCAKCHKLYEPSKYSDEKWRVWMTKMTRKAKLKPDQGELLNRYLSDLRAATRTNKPAR